MSLFSRFNIMSMGVLCCALAFVTRTQAASLALDRSCYRSEMPVSFNASGFAPEVSVDMQYSSASSSLFFLGTLTADGAGNVAGSFPAFGTGSASETQYNIFITDTKTGNAASSSFKSVQLGVDMNPATTKPDASVRFLARGFVETPGAKLYAHYSYSQSEVKKQYLKSVPVGLLDQCGALTSGSVKQLPLTPSKSGVYLIQFDTSPTYAYQPSGRPYIERSVFVDPSMIKAKKRCKIVKRGKRKKKVCKVVKKSL